MLIKIQHIAFTVVNCCISQALDMYKGETAGLQQLGASGVVRVPEPLAAVELPGGGAALVLEYLPMRDLRHHSLILARQLARWEVEWYCKGFKHWGLRLLRG
uniref:protein-ribulosamine 3-kinase n=1 Tax=Scylla olivacea TaxID=85551 RepID=A0A0P4WF05_SCYOL